MEPSNIVNSQEEYDRFVREVVIPRSEAMKANPSSAITFDQLRESMDEWDREDGLLPAIRSEELKRSA